MRQNTSSPRVNLPFQCFHTSTAPGGDFKVAVLFVRGANPKRLKCTLVPFIDHEPFKIPMKYVGSMYDIHRFEALIPRDESTNLQLYSFSITLFDTNLDQIVDIVWYSSLGISREYPLLQHCFSYEHREKRPQFAKDLILYQIFPDRFASSTNHFKIEGELFKGNTIIQTTDLISKNLRNAHCGGNIDGICKMLPYLNEMGFDGIYLLPIFKSNSAIKFDTEDYHLIDERLGGNGALKRLRKESFGYNMRILLHGTFNHTSDNHPWFDRFELTRTGALHHKDSPYRNYYTFKDNGECCYARNIANNVKLNYASRSVRLFMYKGKNSFVKTYLRLPYGIDGWIIDSANQIGDKGSSKNNVKRLEKLCKSAREVHPDCLMLGHFISDARHILTTDTNLDGGINTIGFTAPMRAFFGGVTMDGEPIAYTGEDLRRTCENYAVGLAQQIKLCLINQLDNYELKRFYTILNGEKSLYLAALAVLYTWRGIPCIYQGSELGDTIIDNDIKEHSPIPFLALKEHKVSIYSSKVQKAMQELAFMRRHNTALTNGTLVFIASGGAYFAYIRMFNNRFSIVFVNASRQAMKLEQGSMLFPLFASMYFQNKGELSSDYEDTKENLLIPLSGKNIRRTDHGEGLEGLYKLLSKENLSVHSYGLNKNTDKFFKEFLVELLEGKTITMPARTTVIINNH